MINLKFLSKQILLMTLIFIASFSGLAQTKLTIKWGIENKGFFEERTASTAQSSASNMKANANVKKYRFITTTSMYKDVVDIFFEKHFTLWDEFKKQSSNDSSQTSLNFVKFAKDNDPYYYGIAKSLAPRLYFDFIGETKEYVLESIEIKTINFQEYQGGGFSDNEAWYDIELKHQLGTYTYPVNNKLRFTGSGRTVLRFWSDNYYKGAGLTPSGCFTISIKFNFFVNGLKTAVSTGVFKIDV